MSIVFEKSLQEASLHNPFQGFREVHQSVEIRRDPLTGRRCRINIDRAKRPEQVPSDDDEYDRFFERSRAKCFFCPENIQKMTPTFAGDLPERIRAGNSWLFPNLFPFGRFHAIAVLSSDHHLELNQFTPELIEDCLRVCLRYLKLVKSRQPEISYWSINWNYMPPAGASIVHPHLQILADSDPGQYLAHLIDASKSYYERNRRNYWADLVEAEEQQGDRFIGRIGSVNWLTSFAPQGNREVQAIFSKASSLAHLEENQLSDLCIGLSSILKGYHSCGVKSLNMATFSGSCDEDLRDFYLLNLRLISRPPLSGLYVNDNAFMEIFHREPIVVTIPEDFARNLRRSFPH